MFLIGSGFFDATIDGKHVRTMHRGEHFGEIALLFDAPRTATVRCLQVGTLWRLGRQDFMAAITGNTATKDMIEAIAHQRLAHAGTLSFPSSQGS